VVIEGSFRHDQKPNDLITRSNIDLEAFICPKKSTMLGVAFSADGGQQLVEG
jgi:hypothetical protein